MAGHLAPLHTVARARFVGCVANRQHPATSPHQRSTAASAEPVDQVSQCLRLTRFAFLPGASMAILVFALLSIFLLDQRPLGMKLQTVCRNLIGSRLKGIGETAVQPSHRSPGTAHCHSRSDVVVFLIGMRDPFGDCGFRATLKSGRAADCGFLRRFADLEKSGALRYDAPMISRGLVRTRS